jgi:hypothetical protein
MYFGALHHQCLNNLIEFLDACHNPAYILKVVCGPSGKAIHGARRESVADFQGCGIATRYFQ